MTKIVENYTFDPTVLEDVLIDRDHWYSVMRDPTAGIAVLEIHISWIVGYNVYFWLSSDDLSLLQRDKPGFDKLVHDYALDKGERFFKDRLLLNQGPGGNRHAQSKPERAYGPGPNNSFKPSPHQGGA